MNDIAVIHLTNGGFTVVDADLFDELSKHNWQLKPSGHVYRCNGKKSTVNIHQVVNKTPAGFDTDHKNKIKTDNRRINLRTSTHGQNSANKNKYSGAYSSRFKGVSWCSTIHKWIARIRVNYRTITLGRFDSEIKAALAYNESAKIHFGAFATLNEV